MNRTTQRPRLVVLARLLRLLSGACLALYLVVCVVMAVSQRSFIYCPASVTRDQVDQMAQSARLQRWTNSAGQFIGLKRPSPKQPADGTVMVAYGNGSTATGCSHFADEIQNAGAFDVFILEYPGYEDRPGSPTQASLFQAAAEAFQMLPADKPVYLLGESLGTGVAAYLTGTHASRIAGVVLISPFNRLSGAARNRFPLLPVGLLLVDRFPSDKYLSNYHGKVGITVGGKDVIVPEELGLRLYNGYAGPKKLWAFPDGGHCQIMQPPSDFWNEVIAFWQATQPPPKRE